MLVWDGVVMRRASSLVPRGKKEEARWSDHSQSREEAHARTSRDLFGTWSSRKPKSGPSSPAVDLAEIPGSVMTVQCGLICSTSPLPGWDLRA